jgi:hypothetical protein
MQTLPTCATGSSHSNAWTWFPNLHRRSHLPCDGSPDTVSPPTCARTAELVPSSAEPSVCRSSCPPMDSPLLRNFDFRLECRADLLRFENF